MKLINKYSPNTIDKKMSSITIISQNVIFLPKSFHNRNINRRRRENLESTIGKRRPERGKLTGKGDKKKSETKNPITKDNEEQRSLHRSPIDGSNFCRSSIEGFWHLDFQRKFSRLYGK